MSEVALQDSRVLYLQGLAGMSDAGLWGISASVEMRMLEHTITEVDVEVPADVERVARERAHALADDGEDVTGDDVREVAVNLMRFNLKLTGGE